MASFSGTAGQIIVRAAQDVCPFKPVKVRRMHPGLVGPGSVAIHRHHSRDGNNQQAYAYTGIILAPYVLSRLPTFVYGQLLLNSGYASSLIRKTSFAAISFFPLKPYR